VYNLTHHFPDKQQVRIGQKFLKRLIIHERVSLKMHEQMNVTKKIRLLGGYIG